MRKFLGLMIFLGLFALPMMAQKVEVFGGYQHTHFDEDFPINHANGWDGSATYNFSKMLGVTADISGAYHSIGHTDAHLYTYTFGPVASFKVGPVKPFVHALAGGAEVGANGGGGKDVSDNGFAGIVGGGVDVKVDRHFALRLFQADWVYYHFGDSHISSGGTVKLATGIVARF